VATIGTTTANPSGAISSAFGYPPNPMMDLNVKTGVLWIVFRDTTNRVAIYSSSDNGVSWTFQANFSQGGYTIEDICAMRIDASGDHLHMILLANNGSAEVGLYKRVDIRSGTPDTSANVVLFTGPLGTNQSFEQTGALVPVKNPDGSYHIFVAFAQIGTTAGITVYAITVRSDLSAFVNDGIIGPGRVFKTTNSDSSITVSVDVEHNGDGITSATPNVWAAFLIGTTTYVLRAVWKGYKAGWQTPNSSTQLATLGMSERDQPAVWEGQRYMVIRPAPGALSSMQILECKTDNSGVGSNYVSPNHPQGNIVGAKALSYNYVTRDIRIFAAAASGTNIYYIDWFRATNSWGSWTDTGLNPVGSEWGLRRGTWGTAQYDMYYETGTSSPWTISNAIWAVNFAPTAPTWVTGTAGTVSRSGAAFDASANLTLDWDFHDPNASDTQTAKAIQRQIGTNSPQWWRSSDSTWQSFEVFNTSSTTSITFSPSSWLGAGGASDPAHVYKVAVQDSGGLTSPYSDGLSIVPSTRVDPTLTAPTTGSTLNVGNLTPTWTVSEQSAYRVVVINTVTGATVYDSGFQSDPTPNTPSILSYTVPVALPDGFAGQVQLTTKNVEGLSSTTRTANFTIDFVEPVAPVVSALTASPATGGISVTVTQAAPSGAQPTTQIIDIWRRKSVPGTLVALNANPFFETNANDWTSSGYSTIARSTSQAHTGTASLLCTPNGTTATPKAQTTALYPVTTGDRYEFRGWLRATTTNKTLRIYIDWYTSGGSLISSTTRDLTPVAGVWIWAWVRGTAPDTAAQARIAVGELATPAAGDTLFADELQLLVANDDDGIRIVTNAVSGTPYLDWRAVTGVDYEYRAYAGATNGTLVWGQWTD
jgi:hypothetical protein